MSDWFPVPDLAGTLEDIHRVVPMPLLHCLGCVRRVIVMLEGELSAQSEVLSALNQVFIKDISVFSCIQLCLLWSLSQSLPLKYTPAAWCCRHHASPLGWYYAGDKQCLVSLRHKYRIEFHQTRESFFFIELFGCIFANSNQGFMYLYWGEAWVWSHCHQAQIGGVSQWCLSFCKFLLSPYKIMELNQSDHQCFDHLSNQDPSPSIA